MKTGNTSRLFGLAIFLVTAGSAFAEGQSLECFQSNVMINNFGGVVKAPNLPNYPARFKAYIPAPLYDPSAVTPYASVSQGLLDSEPAKIAFNGNDYWHVVTSTGFYFKVSTKGYLLGTTAYAAKDKSVFDSHSYGEVRYACRYY